MNIRRKTNERLSKHFEGIVRIAATGPGEAPAIEQALSGDLQNNAGQTNTKRAIPEDYKYDPAAIKPLAKMLWSMSVSLGHALAAHKAFVRLKSSTISPDGMLGGRGYVMAVKDVRTMLHDACEALSALCDTIHDEINAEHWQPKLAGLEKADVDRIRDLLSEAQGYLDDPEEMTKEDEEEAESGHAGWHHPEVSKDNKRKKEPRSDLPGGGDKETGPQAQPLRHDMRKSPNPQNEKQASGGGLWLDASLYIFEKDGSLRPPTLVERVAARALKANSTQPVETMPGGPRVDHLDRADTDQTGPFGTYDHEHGQPDDEMELSDEWRRDDGIPVAPMSQNSGPNYNYPSDFDNDLHEKQANGALGYAFFPPGTDLETALPNFMKQVFDAADGKTALDGELRYPPQGFSDQASKEAALLDNMIKDLHNRKKLEVTNPHTKQDFFVLMKEPKKDKFNPDPKAWYAPSEDGHKPAEQWMPMDDTQLRNWLQNLRPRPHAVAANQAGWSNSWQPWTNPRTPTGTSAIPDSNSDTTPTEGFDFGIGDGNGDEARGQGAGGYGEGNPGAPDTNPGGGTGNRGVYGPQSGIPKDPGGKVNPDESDSNLTIENEIGGKGRYATELGDPWAVSNNTPGTKPFAAPDFQEATREEPTREANADKPWGQDHDGWVMGLDPETLIALGSVPTPPSLTSGLIDMVLLPGTKEFVAADLLTAVIGLDETGKYAWYDGVYDFERPVEPVGQSKEQGAIDPGYTFAEAALPAGPQEPFVGMFMEPDENFDYGGELPGDENAGVARTDYFDGPKPINMQDSAPSNVGATKVPGEQMPTPPKPVTQRPSHNQEHEFATMNPLATGELPGDGTTVNYDFNRDLGPDQTTTYEQDNTPYIKWDDNTHEMRPDPIQQRGPVQGPYVHNDLTERPSNG